MFLAVLAAAAISAMPAQAQYPERTMRLLVGFAPGGGSGATGVIVSEGLSAALGKPVVLDHRPGASGNVAAEITAKANPDGYTLFLATIAPLAVNPSLYGNLPFNPAKDFASISKLVDATNVLVVSPSLPVKTVADLTRLAKEKPGQLRYTSSGVGTTGHIAGELYGYMAKISIAHQPDRGAGAAIQTLASGGAQFLFATVASSLPQVKSGKLRALSVSTLKRYSELPEVPTMSESGFKGYEANNWYALVAPAKTPQAIITRLNAETVKLLSKQETKDTLHKLGLDASPSSPQALSAYISSETAKWSKLVKEANMKVK